VPRRPGTHHESRPTLPIETLRDWYLTVCGGLSPELALHQIGINREALEANTSLDPTVDRVRVAVVGALRRPILMDRFFEIVPLDDAKPGALACSPMGEAVFPEGDQVLRPGRSPEPGEEVILNNVVSTRLGKIPDPERFGEILQELFRQGFGRERENA